MYQLAKVAATATIASLLLAGCGGGGGSSPSPSQAVKTAATPAPSAASRTSVGNATLTLKLPKVLKANGKVVRAITRGSALASRRGSALAKNSTSRSPQFVDPSPLPVGATVCNNNVLDIYVDGSLLPALDGGPESPDSLCVNQNNADGTQTITLPLYSTNSNTIVVVEWGVADYPFNTIPDVLAIGETEFGGFDPGNVVPIALTMQMNAFSIGITDLGFSSPQVFSGQWPGLEGAPVGVPQQFALYPVDALGDFVPVAGAGGTSLPTISGSSEGGTTSVQPSSIAGIFNVVFDVNGDSFDATVSTINPAFQFVTAVETENGYPGIQNLYFNNAPSFGGQWQSWFFPELNFNPVTGSGTIFHTCCL